jgi:hypothetical protein
VPRTIQHGGNFARNAHTARSVFVELALTGLGYDYFRHSVSRFLVSGTDGLGSAPFVVARDQGSEIGDQKNCLLNSDNAHDCRLCVIVSAKDRCLDL